MNYNRIYASIVLRAKSDEANRLKFKKEGHYYERHHIIPQSLGGSNKNANLVYLTAREHFICHWLLVKIYPIGSDSYNKMMFALWRMRSQPTSQATRYVFSNVYVYLREQFAKVIGKITSKSQTGVGNSQYGKRWYTSLEDGHSERFELPPEYGWVKGKNAFGIGRKYPMLWCIKTKKPITIKHGIVRPNLYDLRKQQYDTSEYETKQYWNAFHASKCTSLNNFCHTNSVTISTVAMVQRFRKYIPIYNIISSQGTTFVPDKSLINKYQ